MRIKASIIVIVTLAVVIASYYLLADRPISAERMENLYEFCQQCHGSVPEYAYTAQVHDRHSVFNCSFCHKDVDGLKGAEQAHDNMKWAGISILALSGLMITAGFVASKNTQKRVG